MVKRVHLTTLGCKVNQFETAAFASGFSIRGLELVDQAEQADIIVVNTCAVTAKASGESRRSIRRLARNNPKARFVVTGCHAQLAAEELNQLAEMPADRLLIIGNDHKDELVARTLAHLSQPLPSLDDMVDLRQIGTLSVQQFPGRTRALLRVQDGCNNFCSYCIVPFTRGRSRSSPMAQIITQTSAYQTNGHHEIVVTGIHVGAYGQDRNDGIDLAEMLAVLSERFPELRFRLSSIEPLEISDRLLLLMRERDNIMPHLHIPLQSGDNEILSLMNRRYTREQFIEKVANCRAFLPDAAIGIDVLVGFPGEQPAHFDNTLALLEESDCSYVHAFPYSHRPGTRASLFSGSIEKIEKQRRANVVRSFGTQRMQAFASRFLGSSRSAVIEAQRDRNGLLHGYTDNYISILLNGTDAMINTVANVELLNFSGDNVMTRIHDQL